MPTRLSVNHSPKHALRVWPFAQLNDWADHKRRSREEHVVATDKYSTDVVDNNRERTGESHCHFVIFIKDGNGRRFSQIRSTSDAYAGRHNGILEARTLWRIHGRLPEGAITVSGEGITKPK